ncbi:aminoglycoside adenylyltransferase domain-containing protein [Virgibacillus salexigens]|uniref:aminoglycoside adenylyltransferase domain-containing protein n=1 Tax=Virgibacillus salexigens TaxID=61016 RepID=UPI00190C52B9|nr:aminoglycoside adenylyltransferase domain-containing protein [Virgibacillus salexigens]
MIIIALHSSIYEVLNEYISLWTERLPNQLEGLYLHGSIVLDAYTYDSSDIDFVVITKNRLTEKEIQILTDIHKVIACKFVKPDLDGLFIVWEDLGESRPADNVSFPYYNGGKIGFNTHFNPVTWWLLKKKGISLLGPDITERPFNVSSRLLTSYVLENMNSYWAGRVIKIENSIEQIKNLPTSGIDEELEWIVLGLLRQYYTLKELSIISKVGAGEYGLLNLPREWHNIINEAVNIRRKIKDTVFNSDEKRINETLQFSKYLIQHCNNIPQEH